MSSRPLGRCAAAGTGIVVAAALAACTAHPSPEVAVRSFLLDWQAGDYAAAARYTTGDPQEVEAALEEVHDQLDLAAIRFSLGPITQEEDTASAQFGVQADLGIGDPVWNYTGSMALERGAGGWAITWSPGVIHPDLGEGERLAVSYDIPERGQILDRAGEALVDTDQVTAFGVVPADMDDKEAGVEALAELLEEDPSPLLNRVRSAPPEQFQPLVLMRQNSVDSALLQRAKQINGVETEELQVHLSPRAARFLIGDVAGTAEHRVSSRVAGPYQAGDTVGLSGLQNLYQHELAGTATTEVVTLDEAGEPTGVLESWPGTESGRLETTLDLSVQRAAENALAGLPGDGYLVAVDASTGEVLAAAAQSDTLDDAAAFTGEYLPGEAFTIVSAMAALDSGAVSADEAVPCGYQTDVGDRTFTNPGSGFLPGEPNVARNLAYTCTTAFAGLGEAVGTPGLEETAQRLGIGQDWQLPVPVFTGEITASSAAEDTAAAMVGADHVRVSPLSMALVAGAVADGSWHAPRLVREEGASPGARHGLDEGSLEAVREGMRDAVVNRMGELLIGEEPVYGQAARTEQGDGALHWFVGYQGDVAFAVVAEVDQEITQWNQYAVNASAAFLRGLAEGAPGEPPLSPGTGGADAPQTGAPQFGDAGTGEADETDLATSD